jgi:hypothetical protein
MTKSSKALLTIVGVAFILAAAVLYALFHGYFDHGQFEIKQVQWSSAGQVAMVAERSDQVALSSYVYFVLTADHVLSPSELRRAYYSSAVVFAAADGCLDLHWQDPTKLVIACNGQTVTRDDIDVEESRSGKIAIVYVNIPSR